MKQLSCELHSSAQGKKLGNHQVTFYLLYLVYLAFSSFKTHLLVLVFVKSSNRHFLIFNFVPISVFCNFKHGVEETQIFILLGQKKILIPEADHIRGILFSLYSPGVLNLMNQNNGLHKFV